MKKLKAHTIDWAQIDRFLAGADKKLGAARKILAFDEEACLQQAYEAMLKASLGFMFSHGFRARSQPGHHIAIIEFVRQRIDRKHAGLLTVWRYTPTNLVSKSAEDARVAVQMCNRLPISVVESMWRSGRVAEC